MGIYIAIKDLNGNVSVSQNELKAKLGLTEEQASQVSKAMVNYNGLPLEAKDNTSSATQSVASSQEMKSEIQEQKGLDEKIAQVMFGGVTASAGGCSRYASTRYFYWGTQTYVNNCLINDMNYGFVGIGTILNILASTTPCLYACVTLASVISMYAGWLNWSNGYCNGNGAYMNNIWPNPWVISVAWVQNWC